MVICSAACCTGIRLAWSDNSRFQPDTARQEPPKNPTTSAIFVNRQKSGFFTATYHHRQAFLSDEEFFLSN
jgi:hypothetical protein